MGMLLRFTGQRKGGQTGPSRRGIVLGKSEQGGKGGGGQGQGSSGEVAVSRCNQTFVKCNQSGRSSRAHDLEG